MAQCPMSVAKIAEHLWLERKGMPIEEFGRFWKFNQSEIDAGVRFRILTDSTISPRTAFLSELPRRSGGRNGNTERMGRRLA